MQPEQKDILQNQQPSAPLKSEPKKEKLVGFRKFHYVFLMLAVVVVPLWIGLGKNILGAHGGWGSVLIIFFLVPFIFAYQVVILILALMNKQSRQKKAVSSIIAWLLTVYYICIFFYTLSTSDGGDTSERFNSVFMNIFGNELGTTLSSLGGVAFLVAFICAIAIFIFLLAELVTKKDSKKQVVTSVENS